MMSLTALAGEEIIHETCLKHGKLRVKKRARLHAIEEFAAQQLVVLPILTSPTPLSPAYLHQTSLLVRCFVKSECSYCVVTVYFSVQLGFLFEYIEFLNFQ